VYGGSDLTVTNSIFWGNDYWEIYHPESTGIVTYSVVEGGYLGIGNIDADPLFVDPEGGDFHLQSGSPCIDAADGDAATDLDFEGSPRVDDPATVDTGVGAITYADMGAYEYQP
jgi:hypothetical protein